MSYYCHHFLVLKNNGWCNVFWILRTLLLPFVVASALLKSHSYCRPHAKISLCGSTKPILENVHSVTFISCPVCSTPQQISKLWSLHQLNLIATCACIYVPLCDHSMTIVTCIFSPILSWKLFEKEMILILVSFEMPTTISCNE